MTIYQYSILGSMLFLIVTAILHSVLGEHYLIRPLLRLRGNKVLDHSLARLVLRFAWHLTSAMWILLALILFLLAFDSVALEAGILLGTGITFTAVGLLDMVISKGRHIGWPPLLATGLCALTAYQFLN